MLCFLICLPVLIVLDWHVNKMALKSRYSNDYKFDFVFKLNELICLINSMWT